MPVSLTPEQLKGLENLPLDEARSRLEPFKPLILRWRRQGRSYRSILGILRKECHLEVAYGPLYRFVQRRSRPRKAQPEIETEPATGQPVESSSAAALPVVRKPRMSIEERRAQADAIRERLSKPTLSAKPTDTRPLFDYDEDQL